MKDCMMHSAWKTFVLGRRQDRKTFMRAQMPVLLLSCSFLLCCVGAASAELCGRARKGLPARSLCSRYRKEASVNQPSSEN